MIVERKALADALGALKKACGGKSTLPSEGMVLLERTTGDLHLFAENNTTAMQVSLEAYGDGEIDVCLPIDTIVPVTRISEDALEITKSRGKVVFSAGTMKLRVDPFDVEGFRRIQTTNPPILVLSSAFANEIGSFTSKTIKKNLSGQRLQRGVKIQKHENHVHFASLDGIHLACARLSVDDILEENMQDFCDIVDNEVLSAVLTALQKTDVVSFHDNGNTLIISSEQVHAEVAKLNFLFPPYEELLAAPVCLAVSVPRLQLLEKLQIAAAVCGDRSEVQVVADQATSLMNFHAHPLHDEITGRNDLDFQISLPVNVNTEVVAKTRDLVDALSIFDEEEVILKVSENLAFSSVENDAGWIQMFSNTYME